MASNRLQLNHAKTEVLWCSSSRQQYQVPSDPVRMGSTDVQPVSSVRDLGVYIDADMSLSLSDRVLRLFVKSGVYVVLFHVMPC